jgi:hypothetical protein
MGDYSDAALAQRYAPGERMAFCNGGATMTAERAERFAFGLVELDRETGLYRRAQSNPGLETSIIDEAKYRESFLRSTTAAPPGNRLR